MLLQNFLINSAQKFPGKVAIFDHKHHITYHDLDQETNKLANGLIDLGVKRGERVAVFLDNSIESVIALFGVLKAGAAFVMLDSALKAGKLEYILRHCGARVFISHQNKSRIWGNISSLFKMILVADRVEERDRGDIGAFYWDELMDSSSECCPARQNIDLDLAAIIYTSGSTGTPKGVMLTHLNMVSAATSISSYLKNTSDDIIMNVLPLSFDYGLYQVLMSVKFGGTLILEKSFLYPYVIIEKIIKEKVTGFPLVPTMAAMLLQMDRLKSYDFNSLRYITNTGAVLPESHIRKLKAIFPQTQIYSMYGLTECKRVSYLPPEELDNKPDSVGKPMPNVEVYLVDAQGHKLVTPGAVGELVVRGSNVMKGYWDDPVETDKFLKEDRQYPGEKVLYTGDFFKMDEEGDLFFVARKDDLIKTRGERVSPREIENVICQIEGVSEAVVIGVPDDILGQAIKAFILLERGYSNLNEKGIIAYCLEKLEFFMVPKYIKLLNEFPRTSTGKTDRKRLGITEQERDDG